MKQSNLHQIVAKHVDLFKTRFSCYLQKARKDDKLKVLHCFLPCLDCMYSVNVDISDIF